MHNHEQALAVDLEDHLQSAESLAEMPLGRQAEWLLRAADLMDRAAARRYASGSAESASALTVAASQARDRGMAIQEQLTEELVEALHTVLEKLPPAEDQQQRLQIVRDRPRGQGKGWGVPS